KAGADFEKTGHAAIEFGSSGRWFGDPGQDLQQRAFARSVSTDHSDDLAGHHIEGDALQCPYCSTLRVEGRLPAPQGHTSPFRDRLAQAPVRRAGHPDCVLLRKSAGLDDRTHVQITSANRLSMRRKVKAAQTSTTNVTTTE